MIATLAISRSRGWAGSQDPGPERAAPTRSPGAMAPILQRAIPGAAGIEHPVLTGAGHFLQEDAGGRLAAEIVSFIAAHPARV
jgi:pimeloyl-ACP methyl ester carboxylesterase